MNTYFTSEEIWMANKHMKILSIINPSIKIIMRKLSTPFRIAKITNIQNRKLTMPSSGEDVEQLERSFIAGGNANRYSHFGKLFGG